MTITGPGRWALGLFALSAYLTLVGLDNNHFWDDEAQTALMAKSFAETGRFSTWDGRNLYTYHQGAMIRPDLEFSRLIPKASFVMAAASFALLGPSTFSGRLPFALAGLAALALFWPILKRQFPERPGLALYAFALTGLSAPLLLYFRQCRYYALAVLCALATYHFYQRALDRRRWMDFLAMSATAVLFFFTSYLLCVAFVATLGLSFVIFRARELDRPAWVRLGTALTIVVLATVPYAVTYRVWHIDEPTLPDNVWYVRRAILVWLYFRDLGAAGVLPWMALVGIAAYLLGTPRDQPLRRPVAEWLFIAVANAVVLALGANQPSKDTMNADVRYLVVSVPFAAGAMASVLWEIHRRWHAALAMALLAAHLCTNWLALHPANSQPRWLLPAYVAEIHGHTQTPDEMVSRFLLDRSAQDDLVFVVPDFFSSPLVFYAGHRVKLCCSLGEKIYTDWRLIDPLGAPVRMDRHFPDWIIAYQGSEAALQALQFFSRPHLEHGRSVTYRYVAVAVLDVLGLHTQRPELPWHQFGTVRQFDRQSQAVYVLKRELAR